MLDTIEMSLMWGPQWCRGWSWSSFRKHQNHYVGFSTAISFFRGENQNHSLCFLTEISLSLAFYWCTYSRPLTSGQYSKLPLNTYCSKIEFFRRALGRTLLERRCSTTNSQFRRSRTDSTKGYSTKKNSWATESEAHEKTYILFQNRVLSRNEF